MVNPKNRFKVLHDKYFKVVLIKFSSEKEKQDYLMKKHYGYLSNEIEPIFNRDGRYIDRQEKIVWVERFGRAWLLGGKSYEDFLYDIKNHKANNRITEKHYYALLELSKHQKLPKELSDLIYTEQLLRQVRQIHVQSRLRCNKILKEIKNERDKTNR